MDISASSCASSETREPGEHGVQRYLRAALPYEVNKVKEREADGWNTLHGTKAHWVEGVNN